MTMKDTKRLIDDGILVYNYDEKKYYINVTLEEFERIIQQLYDGHNQ